MGTRYTTPEETISQIQNLRNSIGQMIPCVQQVNAKKKTEKTVIDYKENKRGGILRDITNKCNLWVLLRS